MPPHIPPPPPDPPLVSFPSLPIVTPDPPRRSTSERYGGLFTLGLVGLVVVVALVGWFGFGAWSMRDVWSNIYVLHDAKRPEAERIRAAYALSRDPRLNARQIWDMCLRTPLPGLARYLLAEALTADAVSADPRGYAVAVARSPGWPDWLRLLLTRPLAYAAARGLPIPREPLVALAGHPDPAIALWATFALAAGRDADPQAATTLEREAARDGPDRALAGLLLEALRAEGPARARLLDRATLWLRTHHPEAARLWAGWAVRDGRLEPESAPKLQ